LPEHIKGALRSNAEICVAWRMVATTLLTWRYKARGFLDTYSD
jgi:hypothetical protein